MSGVHDADQAFGMNFHAGDAQAQVDGRRLRKRGFGLHIASAQTQVRQLTLVDRVRFARQKVVRMSAEPLVELLAHGGIQVKKAQADLAVRGRPGNFGGAVDAPAAGKLERYMKGSRGRKRFRRQNLHPTGAEVEYDAFDDIAFVIGAIGDAQRDLRLNVNAQRFPALAL